jgi:hypothetical protein
MSTKAIRNFIDEAGDRCPELRDAALAEADRIETKKRLARQQVCALLNECRKRVVLDPDDIIEGLERLSRILGMEGGE